MKIIITRENLLKQLPDPLPETIILDGLPTKRPKPEKDPIAEIYPEVHAVLTPNQWRIFSEIQLNGDMTKMEFAKYFRSDSSNLDNHVAVYVSAMNKKFEKHELPFRIAGNRRTKIWTLHNE